MPERDPCEMLGYRQRLAGNSCRILSPAARQKSRRLVASALLHQISRQPLLPPDPLSNWRLPNFRRAEGRDSRATFRTIDNYPHDALTAFNEERNVDAPSLDCSGASGLASETSPDPGIPPSVLPEQRDAAPSMRCLISGDPPRRMINFARCIVGIPRVCRNVRADPRESHPRGGGLD
jgi:hypothetical protein